MEYTLHQRNILKGALERHERNMFIRAAKGDKVARHYTEELLGIGDYQESDMDGPIGYQE